MSYSYKVFILTTILLALPSFLTAKDTLMITGAVVDSSNFVEVVLKIHNDSNLTALVIPLSFTKGVELKEVNFKGTRVEYFDLQVATINNEKRTVLIGLLPQMSPKAKPDLPEGVGTIANLTFEIVDPSIESMTIDVFKITKPPLYIELTFENENTKT